MVSPKDFAKIAKYFDDYGMEYSTMVEDVESAVEKENEKHSGTMFSTYSGFDYGRYHNLREVKYTFIDFATSSTYSSYYIAVDGSPGETRINYLLSIKKLVPVWPCLQTFPGKLFTCA